MYSVERPDPHTGQGKHLLKENVDWLGESFYEIRGSRWRTERDGGYQPPLTESNRAPNSISYYSAFTIELIALQRDEESSGSSDAAAAARR